MIRRPTCPLAHQPCERVCIHPECASPAFICNSADGCEAVHKHIPQNQLTIAQWSQIEQFNNNIFKKTDEMIQTTIKEVADKVEIIIGEMRQTLFRYTQRLSDIRGSLKLKQGVGDVRNYLLNGDYGRITGKQMGFFYQSLKNQNQFENNQHILVAIAQLNEKGYKLIQSIRKRINDYLHKEADDKHEQKQKHSDEDKMSKLTQKIKKDPNNPERYFQRGLEFSKIGKIREAEEDYNMALQLNPNYIDARLNRGIIFYNSNRFQQAQQDYITAIQLDPNNCKAYNNRGRLYHDCRKLAQAEEDYKKAIALSPGFVKCYLNRAMLYNESHRLKEAEDDYTKIISLQDNNSKAFSNRGLLRFHQNRFEEAEADYNRAIELDPTNDGTLNNRGYLFFMTNQFDKALSDYNRAIAIRQKPLYFKNRSDVLFKLGRHSEADEDLNRAKQLKSKSLII